MQQTPHEFLCIAVANGRKDVCDIILRDMNTSPNLFNSTGVSPLFIAVSLKNLEIVKTLLQYNADPNKGVADIEISPLFAASDFEQYDICKALLEKGADANKQDKSEGEFPLLKLAEKNETEITKLLLEHKADPNLRTFSGFFPLLIAVEFESDKTIRILLENGANPNMQTPLHKITPLLLSCQNGYLKIAQILVEFGADVNYAVTQRIPNSQRTVQVTPLCSAVHNKHNQIANFLPDSGKLVGSFFYVTTVAIMTGNTEMFKILEQKLNNDEKSDLASYILNRVGTQKMDIPDYIEYH